MFVVWYWTPTLYGPFNSVVTWERSPAPSHAQKYRFIEVATSESRENIVANKFYPNTMVLRAKG